VSHYGIQVVSLAKDAITLTCQEGRLVASTPNSAKANVVETLVAKNGIVYVLDAVLSAADDENALTRFSATRIIADVFPLVYHLIDKAELCNAIDQPAFTIVLPTPFANRVRIKERPHLNVLASQVALRQLMALSKEESAAKLSAVIVPGRKMALTSETVIQVNQPIQVSRRSARFRGFR